ncbi:methyltransferase domain-containing protein [Luteolibacter ambystomatis]|uniref:Methyltransferase domain-containing protein n=1 Tax=Luteolibacter ambystomatis TaxID=2824561 RepID=A0A975J3I2_9BACT|nr:methyltransferase domain-containing protein [Luteolibacter ambystomatis]
MEVDLTRLPDTDPIRAYRYRDGIYAGDLVTAALVHLDFFTWLAEHPSDLPAICRQFGFAATRPADVMMTLFAANGFVRSEDGMFHVTESGREALTAGSPWSLAPYYASLKDRPVTMDYLKVLATGKPAKWGSYDAGDWHKLMEDDAFARLFTTAMDCRGVLLGPAMAQKLDLSRFTRLVDIGGGSGIYACSLVANASHLSAVVFDQASVERIARRRVAELGYADRVEVVAGDMFRDPLPDDCDLHLFSNVLHDWDEPEVRELLAVSYRALKPGGMLILHDAFINADKTGPLPVAEYSAMLMHSTQGKCYSVGEYEALLTEAGFHTFTCQDTAADRGVMTALKS